MPSATEELTAFTALVSIAGDVRPGQLCFHLSLPVPVPVGRAYRPAKPAADTTTSTSYVSSM